MRKFLKIESKDHTDILIFVDKIQCVIEKKDGCTIAFDNGTINSTAKIKDVEDAICKLLKGGGAGMILEGCLNCEFCNTKRTNSEGDIRCTQFSIYVKPYGWCKSYLSKSTKGLVDKLKESEQE